MQYGFFSAKVAQKCSASCVSSAHMLSVIYIGPAAVQKPDISSPQGKPSATVS